MPCCQTCSRTSVWDFKSGKKGWGWLNTSPIIFQQCFFASAPHEFVNRPKDMIAKKAGRDYETMRDLSDFYQPDWQKGQNVEGLRLAEVCSETRKHWKPFTTVHSWAVELSQADHSVLRLLQISQQHIEFLGWVKWNRRDSPVWVVGSLEKSIRVPSVSQKWGHNWSVWSMSVSFGGGWTSPTTTTSVSRDAALYMWWIMD